MVELINTGDLTPETFLGPDLTYWVYNGLDCCVTHEIFGALQPQLDEVTSKTYEMSLALQGPFLDMVLRGIRVNPIRKQRTITDFRTKLERLQGQFDRIISEGLGIGGRVNWRSPAQLNNLMYDVMALPVQKKRNANGIYAPTTDREALEKLTMYFIAEPVINHILAMRDLGKSISFLETGIDADGRMRTSVNIAGTNTGRLSSSASDLGTGTNLQNVDRDLRSVFCADPGYKFGNLDLEQADARNLGALIWNIFLEEMGEREAGKFLDACESGDLHTFVTKMARPELPWGTAPDREIADRIAYRLLSHRDMSKKLGHGSNFVGQPPTMSKHTKIPVGQVREFQEQYFRGFPAIPRYHNWVRDQLMDSSQLTTLFGRRRYFWGRPDDAATLREAVAYQPQSMTGDEINTGILRMWRSNRVQLLMQVHDSILFQYREEEEDEIIPWALEVLKAPLTLAGGRHFVVPTEAKVGWNWGDVSDKNPDGLKKYKGHDSRTRTEDIGRLDIRML